MKRTSLLLSLICILALASFAQGVTVTSPVASVQVTYDVNESITASITGGPIVMTGVGMSLPATANVTYALNPATHATGLLGGFYFAAPTAALVNGPVNIPSSSILAKIDSGASAVCNTTINGNVGGGCGSAKTLASNAALTSTPVQNTPITTTITLDFNAGPTVPGHYAGTLNYVAWAP